MIWRVNQGVADISGSGEALASGIHLKGVVKRFGNGTLAVNGVSLEIQAGDFVAFLGPSGCGKSTLLKIISGLDEPTEGVLEVTGPNVGMLRCTQCGYLLAGVKAGGACPECGEPAVRARSEARADGVDVPFAYVFQDPHLLPWRRVLSNVALPLELVGVDKKQRLETAQMALETVGLADAARKFPSQLSGGMRMRVSLARALVTQPKVMLLDEPFAALDELTRQRLDEQLRALWVKKRMTVIFVTHSISEAAFLANRAVVFSARPATVMLDTRLDLPLERAVGLRQEAGFVAQTRALHEALVKGGA